MPRNLVVVDFVIEQFRAMGGTEEELREERQRLMQDDAAYSEWCLRVREWCDVPHWIAEAMM